MPNIKKYLSRQAITDLINIHQENIFEKIKNRINSLEQSKKNKKLHGIEPSTYRNKVTIKWRIIWTKNNENDFIILRILPRKIAYDELDHINIRKRIYKYIQNSKIEFSSFLNSYFRYFPHLSEEQKIVVKKETTNSYLELKNPEINIFEMGNDYLFEGGAGTGKTIIASDLAINFLKTAQEKGFNAIVYYLLPEKLIDYCKQNPEFNDFISNNSLIFNTFQNWLIKVMGFNSSYYIPDWIELEVLRIEAQDNNLSIQDLVLFQIYVLDNKNQKPKELTWKDHEKKINLLKKIKISKFMENVKEFFAFYLVINKLLNQKIDKYSLSWPTLYSLYLYYIKNSPKYQSFEIEQEIFLLGERPNKKIKDDFIYARENLDNRKILSTRIGLLDLGENEVQNFKSDKSHVLIIVDETQDLLEREVAFISKFANQNRKIGIKTNVRYFGDLCQRIYPTGFMWEQIPKHNGGTKSLSLNYRNSNNVLEFSNQFLELQNKYGSEKDVRKFIKELKYVGISDGEKLRIHVVENAEDSLNILKFVNDQIPYRQYGNSLRKTLMQLPVVLVSSNSKINDINFSNYHNLLILEIYKAKGMEFYSNICFCPFLKKEINSQNLMEWYTMFSRTEERMLLILTKEEKTFLENNGISFANFNFDYSINDSIKWINERNQIKLQGLDLEKIKEYTKDHFDKGQTPDDIYEILNESGSEVKSWEEYTVSELKKLSKTKIKQLFVKTRCISIRCLILRTFGNYWYCCKIANSHSDIKERDRIIKEVINDLHNKHHLHIEAERVKHFYLNNKNNQFDYNKHDFQFNDVGKINTSFDEYIISFALEKITNSIEEALTNHG